MAALTEVTDVWISYLNCTNGSDLLVVVHPTNLPLLPDVPESQTAAHVFMKQVSVGSIVEALDDLFTCRREYFSAGIYFGGVKFRDAFDNACVYRLSGAAGIPLGSWLPSDFEFIVRALDAHDINLPKDFYYTPLEGKTL